jgi:hypothetical protein
MDAVDGVKLLPTKIEAAMSIEPQKPPSKPPESQSCHFHNSFLLDDFYACIQSSLKRRLKHRNISHSRLAVSSITTTKISAENIIMISEQAFQLLYIYNTSIYMYNEKRFVTLCVTH